MPNGGSDCCGTCWFNTKNKGEAGYAHAFEPGPNHCQIRDLSVENPFYTYCANHPQRNPDRLPEPIGPVYTGDSQGQRVLWRQSPDSEPIRKQLLNLLAGIPLNPPPEHPLGLQLADVVIWQAGEFREPRAIPDLTRIAEFPSAPVDQDPFGRTRDRLKALAQAALEKFV